MKSLLLLASLLLLSFPASATQTLVAASDLWPPFIDPNNPTDGLSMEIVRAAYKTQDYDIKLIYVPWARAEDETYHGVYDLLPNVWHTEARAKTLFYSTAYLANTVKFIKVKGDPFEYDGLHSLKGKVVGTLRGYNYGDAFLNDSGFVREEVEFFITNIKKLMAKRIDVTLEDEIVCKVAIAQNDPAMLDKVEFCKNPLSVNQLHVASGLKNPRHKEIVAAFNKGLAVIKVNGTYDAILKKYGMLE